ncbi:HlyD family type I secretion periplasmic adaptor subunit [Paraburkholderia phenazinium]|uniref:Membrane fusion protein (MFP) family protein n=1 Tax=Paraburkholderia phenazinium TaxID=60549 RepID=A0A1G7U6D0_9BURK|nr:HlyD family type I secretion periplasmic adaptor subunit [Paraburkholderia phenazinium]SDG42918.1 hemolysin D [Paraburkholderia phenazinium]
MNSLRLQALGDLCRRYGAIFGSAWAIRDQLDTQPRPVQELQFLPANLELIETPTHPAPRWTIRVIVALACVVLLIAVFGRLDIVATAKGKLIPGARVKVIQPAITGVVRQILVHDGQRVTAGRALLVLDATQAAADSDKARSAKIDAALASARARALLTAQQTGSAPVIPTIEGASSDKQTDAQRFAEGLYREYADKLAGAKAELLKRQAELGTTLQEVAKLSATAPLARKEANDYKALAVGSYVAQHDYLEKERTALEQEHELAAQESHAQELKDGIVEQQSVIESTTSQFRREQLDALDKATQQFDQNRDEETKADTRQRLLTLYSPVAGTVQQLSVHTLGGVVTTAQSLMEIVPDDAVEVEANIENKDIGFINAGQDAIVKIEAFPYTRYGYLRGKVVAVSNDAVQDKDKKLGLTFVARVRLSTSQMHINNKWINLTPGMEVTAEIKTGRRSVAGYFLDPLMQDAEESLRER